MTLENQAIGPSPVPPLAGAGRVPPASAPAPTASAAAPGGVAPADAMAMGVADPLARWAGGPRETVVVAHRGDATKHPENTLPALKAALDRGATGLEIDITITADGQLVLWHDENAPGVFAGGLVPAVREAGLERGQRFRPVNPPDGKHVHQLSLAELRRTCGYVDTVTDARVPAEIPTLEAVLQALAADPRLARLNLDVKLPPGDAAVHRRFAEALKAQLAKAGMGDRVNLLVDEKTTLGNLRAVMGPDHRWSYDAAMSQAAFQRDLGHADYRIVERAIVEGYRTVSFGRPQIGKVTGFLDDVADLFRGALTGEGGDAGTWQDYLAVMRRARADIDASGQDIRLVAWTVNDPDELADLLAIPVDEILTDRPALLARVKAEVAAGTYRYERPRGMPIANAVSSLADTLLWPVGATFSGLRRLVGALGAPEAGKVLEDAGFGALRWVKETPIRAVGEALDHGAAFGRKVVRGLWDGITSL